MLGGYKASEKSEIVASPESESGCHRHALPSVTIALATCVNNFIQLKIAQGMGYPKGQRKWVSRTFTRNGKGKVQVL